jgi:hypothetical protein
MTIRPGPTNGDKALTISPKSFGGIPIVAEIALRIKREEIVPAGSPESSLATRPRAQSMETSQRQGVVGEHKFKDAAEIDLHGCLAYFASAFT